jgi:hypothetical protein
MPCFLTRANLKPCSTRHAIFRFTLANRKLTQCTVSLPGISHGSRPSVVLSYASTCITCLVPLHGVSPPTVLPTHALCLHPCACSRESPSFLGPPLSPMHVSSRPSTFAYHPCLRPRVIFLFDNPPCLLHNIVITSLASHSRYSDDRPDQHNPLSQAPLLHCLSSIGT